MSAYEKGTCCVRACTRDRVTHMTSLVRCDGQHSAARISIALAATGKQSIRTWRSQQDRKQQWKVGKQCNSEYTREGDIVEVYELSVAQIDCVANYNTVTRDYLLNTSVRAGQ